MREFLQATSDGLALAAIYALAAASFVIIYRATTVFNFAEGALMLLGGYLLYQFSTVMGLPLGVALVLAIVTLAAFGALLYLGILMPMTGQPTFALIIVTMGISIAVVGLVGVYWGFAPLPVEAPLQGADLHLGTTAISQLNVAAIIGAAVVIAGLGVFFKFTSMGLQMRATAESPTLASRRGVNVQKVYVVAWCLAAAIAGFAGILIAYRAGGAAPSIETVGLRAFPAALIGGFDSLKGAAVGAAVVGLAQTYATLLWGASVQDAVVFGAMLLVLLVRPYGLFGTPEVLRV